MFSQNSIAYRLQLKIFSVPIPKQHILYASTASYTTMTTLALEQRQFSFLRNFNKFHISFCFIYYFHFNEQKTQSFLY